MKKYLFATILFLVFGIIANTISAQTTVSSINVTNNTGCALTAYATGADLNCNAYCSLPGVNVNPNTTLQIPFPCPDIDALSAGYFTIIGIRDNATGASVKIGNGCGVNLSAVFVDCQGFNRTATFIAPNTVVVQ